MNPPQPAGSSSKKYTLKVHRIFSKSSPTCTVGRVEGAVPPASGSSDIAMKRDERSREETQRYGERI